MLGAELRFDALRPQNRRQGKQESLPVTALSVSDWPAICTKVFREPAFLASMFDLAFSYPLHHKLHLSVRFEVDQEPKYEVLLDLPIVFRELGF